MAPSKKESSIVNILQLHILLIACLVSLITVLPGIFLVLQNIALMSDAITHAILPGIIMMFLLINNLDSPLLLFGASLAGMGSVFLTQFLIQTERIKKDAAIGLVFPLFFSIGVILITTTHARNTHVDSDMVLLGELAFAPFNRLVINSYDLGPSALWMLGCLAIITIFVIKVFFKEFTLVSFDGPFAQVIGFNPRNLYYLLMALTSSVAVGAFDSIGSIVTIALMIIPPSGALLLCTRIQPLVLVSISISFISSIYGYVLAHIIDASIAGSIAITNGTIFLIICILSPEKGIYSYIQRQRQQKRKYAQALLCAAVADSPASVTFLAYSLNWSSTYMNKVILQALKNNLVVIHENSDTIRLSPAGKLFINKAIEQLQI